MILIEVFVTDMLWLLVAGVLHLVCKDYIPRLALPTYILTWYVAVELFLHGVMEAGVARLMQLL